MSDAFVTGENSVYMIPLDRLDLGLLPLNSVAVKLDDHLKPLWSSCKFKHKEYFEFQIKAEVRSENKSDFLSTNNDKASFYKDSSNGETEDISQMMEIQKCHICNVDVPNMYYIQHMSSNKHKVNTNIANRAMERIKKHINEIYVFNTNTILASTYLCDSCVVVVSHKDKINHENSKRHLLCIKRDELIKDLSELYTDEVEVTSKTDDIKWEEDEVISHEVTSNLNSSIIPATKLETTTAIKLNKDNTSHCSSRDSENDADPHNLGKDTYDTEYDASLTNHMNCETTGTKSGPRKNKQPVDKYNTCLKTYIKFITNKIPALHSIQFSNETQIEIKAENGDRVKVAVDNFHSIANVSTVADNVIKFCKLCRLTLKKHDELEAHKYAEAHVKNIMSPIRDRDCIRKVYNSLWSHCTLCNQLIATKDIHNHVFIQVHIDHLKDALISDENMGNTSIILKTHTELEKKVKFMADEKQISTKTIDDDKNNAETKTKTYIKMISKKMQINHVITVVDENFINIETESGDKITVHINNFHSYSGVNNHDKAVVYCKLCSSFLKGREKESHKFTMQHIYHIMLPIKDVNCIRKLAGIWSHCVLCNERVATVDINSHLLTQKHCQEKETAVMHINIDKKVNFAILENNGNSKSEFEEDQVTNIKNKNVKVNVIETLRKNELMNDNVIEYIKLINDEVEAKHSVTALDETYIQLKAVNGDVVKVNIKNFHSYLSSESEYTQCYLCAKTLFETEEVEHKYTVEHIKRVMLPILDKHCMRELDNGFHCILCNIRLSKACYNNHIQAPTHCDHLRTALINIPKTPVSEEKKREAVKIYPCVMNTKNIDETYCDICDLNIQTHNMKSHMASKKHKINEKNKTLPNPAISKNNLISIEKGNTKNNRVIHCTVCDIDIDTHNMDSHVNGNRHKLNLNANSTSVGNVKTKNTVVSHCDVCNIDIDTHNMNSHKNGIRHKLNLSVNSSPVNVNSKNASVTHCDVCNLDINTQNMNSHIMGYEHKSNLSGSENIEPKSLNNDVRNEAIHYLMEHSINSNHLTCMVCKVKVPFNTSNVSEHIQGALHKKEYKLLMNKNKLSDVKNGYFCSVCKMYITTTTELLHINDIDHKSNLKSPIADTSMDMKSTFCDLCKVEVGVNNMAAHVSGRKHIETYKQNQTVDKIISNPVSSTVQPITKSSNETSHYCEVCKVAVPNNHYNIETHYKGGRHASNLKLEKITISNDKYVCEACDIEILGTTIIEHIKNQVHCYNLGICNSIK